MKREAGENPGQSRCCELHFRVGTIYLPLSFIGGKAVFTGSKSEDLPNPIVFLRLSRKSRNKGDYLFLSPLHFSLKPSYERKLF